ncbi:MAG TPA: hypothetical protein VEY30_04685, partial [Myxococcaceae bacterium]|nr:hypothetical protein [Myxococcaceae bacterium]
MRHFFLTSAVVLAFSIPALAIDVPEGGDALYHQLRSSERTVIAQYEGRGQRGAAFTSQAPLRGQLPSRFEVPTDAYLPSESLRPGASYLLFLSEERDGLRLPTGPSALRPFDLRDAPALREAIARYEEGAKDKAVLKKYALELLGSPVAFLQYSAAADLTRLGLLGKDEIPLVGRLLTGGQPVEPQARQLLLRHLGRLEAKEYATYLEKVLGSREEPVSARVAALDGLRFMGNVEAIRRQGNA